MFSAIKRLAGKTEGVNNVSSPRPAHQAMPSNLRKKFAKGVQYNMKIIIKGDRNVGKTCLFHRLQGQKFIEEYVPTDEIQVTSIQWNYKATDDIVKVEVWDVVDRGRRKKKVDGLKMNNKSLGEVEEEPVLDAEFLDVYKGTNGVIVMMDITKSWTFDYVQREVPKIPNHIPVIILGNHCDMSHHRTTTPDHVTYFIDSLGERPAQVRYAEASMRNGFGLKFLHKFFNLPFLQLQRETLLKQLETNKVETELTMHELDLYQESDDSDYNKFLDNLINKRRALADSVSAVAVASNIPTNVIPSNNPGNQIPVVPRIIGPVGGGTPIPVKNMNNKVLSKENQLSINISKDIAQEVASHKNEESIDPKVSDRSDLRLKNLTKNTKMTDARTVDDFKQLSANDSILSVEDFVPDDGYLDKSFLEDNSQINNSITQKKNQDSDSETETANPLVAEFEDDLSSADEITIPVQPKLSENPLFKQKSKKKDSFVESETNLVFGNQISKHDSNSSLEEELKLSEKLKIGDNEVLSDDTFNDWLSRDSKLRQSPEGGEDLSTNYGTKKDRFESSDKSYNASVTSSNVHLDLLDGSNAQQISSDESSPVMKEKKKHKYKGEDKEKKKKKKSKDKEKDKSDKSNKKKKRNSQSITENKKRDELEEFLNGSSSNADIDAAYEVI